MRHRLTKFAIGLCAMLATFLTAETSSAQCRDCCDDPCCAGGYADAYDSSSEYGAQGDGAYAQGAAEPDFSFNEQSAAFSGSDLAIADGRGGYIDTALIGTYLRFRYESAYDFDRADRAEFFYSTWRSNGGKNPNPPVGFPDPDVDRQELSLYLEYALAPRLSIFVDAPFVMSDPLLNPNVQAFGDMRAGFKFALIDRPDQVVTFQLKNYIPTVDVANEWVGTGHYSIEPGLLYYDRLTEKVTLEAELRDWISIGGAVDPRDGKPFAGNVLRYGVGLSYDLVETCDWTLAPVVEMVGWTVLEGKFTEIDEQQVQPNNPPLFNVGQFNKGPRDAAGDTIVNVKLGARFVHCNGGSFYAGYGRAITGDRWYRDIFRFEYRRSF